MATYSIDYDRTWTSDPGLWEAFVRSALTRGHRVILTTNRVGFGPDRAEVRRALRGVPITDIVFAGPSPKRRAALLAGWDVDVWVDDRPRTVELGLL